MAVEKCDVCGKELTTPESIDRHRGEKCHTRWLEQRVKEQAQRIEYMKALLDALSKS